jgi:hypothetical protein
MNDVEGALLRAGQTGALVRFQVDLDHDQLPLRRLWLRPTCNALLQKPGLLTPSQIEVVRAAFKRFVVGGRFMVVTADSPHREVQALGDIRELKGPKPPFVEMRFKPPPHDLRLFGRFVGMDALVLTTHGAKARNSKTGLRPFTVPDERRRCDASFVAAGVQLEWVPLEIRDSISKASFD